MILTQQFLSHAPDASLIRQAQDAYTAVMADKDAGLLPVLNLAHEDFRVKDLESIATYYRESFETVVVLGTGGSSLGGQALSALLQDSYGLQLHGPWLVFLDNIDPDTFDRFFQALDLQSTGFIVISKSGNTAETTSQLLTIMDFWKDKLPEVDPREHFLLITEPKNSTLTQIANDYHFPTLPHDPKIGGRFAALSLVGLLPAMIAGLNPYKILEGAASILDQKEQGTFISGSAWTMGQYNEQKTLSVMMPYCDRLQLMCKWYRQLWAESLGKEGKGITPIAAYGTVDQHSQLQLYLDGPKDKMFTVLSTHHKGRGHPIESGTTELTGYSIGDLMQAEQNATIQTLHRKGCSVRVFDMPVVNEQALGALMMHFMLETMIVARMMGVNAFDQPAVEDGKILAMQYLKEAQAA